MGVILSGGIENHVLVDKYMPGTELEVDVISDGERRADARHHGAYRAGRRPLAATPSPSIRPYSLTDEMTRAVVECSEKLALALGTKGLVNIQYLVYQGRALCH